MTCHTTTAAILTVFFISWFFMNIFLFLFLIVKQINEVDSDTVMFEDDDDVTLRELPEEDIDAANLHILHELEEV